MDPDATLKAGEIMLDFARITGLEPVGDRQKRYLWTDAFAVCNFLGLFGKTGDPIWRERALRLVDQVHNTLGRYRDDDSRKGWISGLPEREGQLHPTRGGLRIGKSLPERKPGEPYNDRLEWDQDGQYFHYLTKWMHALNRVSRVTGDPKYAGWAIELAEAAYKGFTYYPSPSSAPRMFWKMSIDLSRPLFPSMGQHDPLDGFITFSELKLSAAKTGSEPLQPVLDREIAGIAGICRGMSLATDDPLGIGGLLADASRLAQLMVIGGKGYANLLESVVDSAIPGLRSFASGNTLATPPDYRLAFREIGLSIGLKGVGPLLGWIEPEPGIFGPQDLHRKVKALSAYEPLGRTIEEFWLDERSQRAGTWREHREINMVMLATSLSPEGFLKI